jgi:hypothetical protein
MPMGLQTSKSPTAVGREAPSSSGVARLPEGASLSPFTTERRSRGLVSSPLFGSIGHTALLVSGDPVTAAVAHAFERVCLPILWAYRRSAGGSVIAPVSRGCGCTVVPRG